jgi:hypothetical protein
MPNIKLCILITYLFLGPSAPWAHGGRPACPPSKPALLATQRAHRRDDGYPDGGALGLRTAIPHRSARRYNGVRRLRQHQRGDAQGSP